MDFIVRTYQWIMRDELLTFSLVLVIVFGAWVFVSIAEEVVEGESHELDKRILLSLRDAENRSDPIGPTWFEEMARDITALGSVVALMIFTATTAGYLYFTKQPWIAVFVVIAVLSGTAMSSALKLGFNRPRPDLVPHKTRIYTKSFPSGHSAMSSIAYLTLGAVMARAERRRRAKVFLLAVPVFLLLIVGVSRVYLGVHWPTDVLAGWAFGVSWAAASWLIFELLQRRFHLNVQPESSSP
ncbi:phosphatase PAP2 family protein [Thalassoglobus sp.]|uniref:phosphatase PAP2 family protein n=1 Tax=Thalassoglobus sp. TaxID=2795869 RepID=UPI003AA9092B